MSGIIIWNQPHIMSKILYEFGGLCSKTALCMKADTTYSLIADEEQTPFNRRGCRDEFFVHYSILSIINPFFYKKLELSTFFFLTIYDVNEDIIAEPIAHNFIKRIDYTEEVSFFKYLLRKEDDLNFIKKYKRKNTDYFNTNELNPFADGHNPFEWSTDDDSDSD